MVVERSAGSGVRSDIRWGRVVLAAVLSEIGVILSLMIATGVYMYLIAPGLTDAEYERFGEDVAGYNIAPPASAIAAALCAMWACRGAHRRFVANGILVGIVATVLTIGFVFTAKPEHRAMYMVSYALRIAGGWVGGVLAQWRFRRRDARAHA